MYVTQKWIKLKYLEFNHNRYIYFWRADLEINNRQIMACSTAYLPHSAITNRLYLKVSSQSGKFEFNVLRIVHLNGHSFFDILNQFQENKVFQTAQAMNNILRSNIKSFKFRI